MSPADRQTALAESARRAAAKTTGKTSRVFARLAAAHERAAATGSAITAPSDGAMSDAELDEALGGWGDANDPAARTVGR